MWSILNSILVALFLVSLAILDSYPTYQQENTGKNISKQTFPPCE